MDWKTKCKEIWGMIRDFFAGLWEKVCGFFERLPKKTSKTGAHHESTTRTGKSPLKDVGYVCKLVFHWLYVLRSLFLAIPVVLAAIGLALYNMVHLPEQVGIGLLANGDYVYTLSRGMAVTIPLIVTGVCLVLTACSKRVVYPWLISVFSLVLPVLLLVTSMLAG